MFLFEKTDSKVASCPTIKNSIYHSDKLKRLYKAKFTLGFLKTINELVYWYLGETADFNVAMKPVALFGKMISVQELHRCRTSKRETSVAEYLARNRISNWIIKASYIKNKNILHALRIKICKESLAITLVRNKTLENRVRFSKHSFEIPHVWVK